MKKREEARLKCVVYESTRAPLRGPPSPMGKATIRGYRFSRHNAFPKGESKEEAASPQKKEANPASLRSAAPSKGRGSRGHSLLPMDGGAPKGRRLDGDGGVKKSEEMRLKCVVYESTLFTAGAVPLPQWGRLRYENTAFLDTTPFPKGKAKSAAASPRIYRGRCPKVSG